MARSPTAFAAWMTGDGFMRVEPRQAQPIKRPSRVREDSVKRRMMTANQRRAQQPRHRSLTGENPGRDQDRQVLKRRSVHPHAHWLQQFEKSGYKIHREPPCSGRVVANPSIAGGSLLRETELTSEKCESRTSIPGCTREEQMRWFVEISYSANDAKEEGADVER